MGRSAAEMSAHVVGQVRGMHRIDADGLSNCATCKLGAVGDVSVGGAGGSSSGLSSCGMVSRRTWSLVLKGRMQAHSYSGLLLYAALGCLQMGKAGSVLSLSEALG